MNKWIDEPRYKLSMMHSSHLDLFWAATQQDCLDKGVQIIGNAVRLASEDKTFCYFIDSVRFLEYFLFKQPELTEQVKELFMNGQLEVGACYTDRLENHHDGEALVRNSLYGSKVLNKLLGIRSLIAYHPDLPGLAEQTPQINKKTGIPYYVFARGFKLGAMFHWDALDGSSVIAYNLPVHYSTYSIEEEIIPQLDKIAAKIGGTHILISGCQGDLGDSGVIPRKRADGSWETMPLQAYIKELDAYDSKLSMQQSGVYAYLKQEEHRKLSHDWGESPSKWGTYGSTTNVKLFQEDKSTTKELLEAEKFATICDVLGLKVNVEGVINSLVHRGTPVIRPNYDLAGTTPTNVSEWLEYAWRLMMVTHDHNYGGTGGALSNYERIRCQAAALAIAKQVKLYSISLLTAAMPLLEQSYVVFNSLNWQRKAMICFLGLESNKHYVAIDSNGTTFTLEETRAGYVGMIAEIPSFGYKTISIRESHPQQGTLQDSVAIIDDSIYLRIQNVYYELGIDKRRGTLCMLNDLQTGESIVKPGCDTLNISAFQDNHTDIPDREVNVELLDMTMNNIKQVTIHENNALFTHIRIESELLHAKVIVDITLHHQVKAIDIKPTLYWHGLDRIRINMAWQAADGFEHITYGVPYGAQVLGAKTLGNETSPFQTDELAAEWYARFREIQGWFVMENGHAGLCIATNQSSWDFCGNTANAVLLRNVPSCGDLDLIIANFGELSWDFRLTSYAGGWEESHAYRIGWEQQYPIHTEAMNPRNVTAEATVLPSQLSFVDTDETGVITVLKKSEQDNGYLLRMFQCGAKDKELLIKLGLPLEVETVCNMDESPADDTVDLLVGYEIKTLQLKSK
ncbi:MAG: hypothetical protein K6T85_02655 [Gorillibacterium sp.]|nr:hypothetical protein [Gorillibacterium sp.]